MTAAAAHTPSLAERVEQFQRLALPGQPMMMMHMGTSYLVSDLWRCHQEMMSALNAVVEARMPGEARRLAREAIAKAEARS